VSVRSERIAKIRGNRWIRYSRAEQITKQLEELLLLPKTHRMPNLLVAGQTNNGKTALVMRFVQQHHAHFSDAGSAACIPVIAVQAPPTPDERRLYQAIIAKLYPSFRPSPHLHVLQREALRLLKIVSVKMLVIDEIHHILAGPMIKQRLFLNVVKHLGNELQIPIVAVGTQDAFNALHSDPQLANRFDPAILPRWTMDDDYLRLLASFESALPFERPSMLIEPALALKILTLSEGTIGEMAGLIRRAAIHTIERDGDRITGSVLDACGYIAPSQRRSGYASI
jgi:type II secretory pathway predicted ATPase ExeA